ncbi:MAG: GHKL domain-containing protein [Clostridia bacterium]|nr:GHKL domain-containing protein [Clostridia bacterium]
MSVSERSLKTERLKDIMNYKDIISIVLSILGLVISNIQLVEILKISNESMSKIILYDVVICTVIILINIYSISNRRVIKKMEEAKKSLEEKNRNLLEVTDNIRCFKHDFNNIIQAIDGYIYLDDMESLQVYFKSLLEECNHIKVVDSINCQVIDNPAICGVLLSKYRMAEEKNIQMNVDLLASFKELNEKTFAVSRMLGILLDNAIEATSECEEKIINFEIIKDIKRNKLVITIENTYKDKDVDTCKIFEKNYTTKKDKGNTGLGLWKIQDILRKDNSLELFTTKDEKMFKQKLEIYF